MVTRTSAALVAVAILATLGPWSPALAAPAAVGQPSTKTIVAIETDTSPPLAFPPVIRLRKSAAASANALPVTITWPPATEIGSGVATYELQRRLDGGAWVDALLPSPGARSISEALPTVRAVQYQVRATDHAGNIGPWRAGDAFFVRLASERSSAVHYGGTWRESLSSVHLGGATRFARTVGKTARYAFTGSQVAWIAPRGPTRGSARVYLDGTYVATVNLRSSTLVPRRLVFTYAWTKVGPHRITIRVSGTGRVDVDGFAVLDRRARIPC